MAEGRLIIYMIALLIVSAAAVLSAVRFFAARRQRDYAMVDDDDRPLYDIPLLFQPRPVEPVERRPPAPRPTRPSVERVLPEPTPLRLRFEAVATPPPVADFTSPEPRPDDGPMQLLPGRLEPLNHDTHQEIRFIKAPGVTRFTFGRSPGPAYEHVQLRAATASRMHGYMTFEGGRWRIGNLSETNRVIVNGAPLQEENGRLLEDGDRIEFGEVAFVFRER